MDQDLERLIDQHGINNVLESLIRICAGKAEHLDANWQDPETAALWDRLAQRLDEAQDEAVLVLA